MQMSSRGTGPRQEATRSAVLRPGATRDNLKHVFRQHGFVIPRQRHAPTDASWVDEVRRSLRT